MSAPSALRRLLCLIRWTRPPHSYPSKNRLIRLSLEEDLNSSDRTFDRDKENLFDEYGIEIKYHPRRRGYYLHTPEDEDIDDFNTFVQLLERREKMEFLNQTLTSVRDVGKYLQLERNDQFLGAENLPVLWDALRRRRVITFAYMAYGTDGAALRTIEPGLIFEYRNRWYLDGWDVAKDALRTFGLDRMTRLQLTDQPVTTDRTATYKNLRRHVIGVTAPDGAEPERVVLRFNALQSSYVRSLPLHASQRELPETGDFQLFVVLNPELEKELLSFGEAVEVLEPASLREQMAARVSQHSKTYFS